MNTTLTIIGTRAGRHVLQGEAEDTWVVQSGEEEAKKQPHCSLQLPGEGSAEGGAGLFSLVTSERTCIGMAQSCTRGSDWTLESISVL